MTRNLNSEIIAAALFTLLFVGCDNTKVQRTVNAQGSASAEYPADQVNVLLEIETKGQTAIEAMDANLLSSGSAMKIIEGASEFTKSLQKNATQFGEKSRWVDGQQKREGYSAKTYISFVATDIPKYDSISRLFASIPGASIQFSEFALSNEIKMRDSVRMTALKKAEEKAAFMADCLGMKIGHPTKITEGDGMMVPSVPSGIMQNSVAENFEAPSSGTISVNSVVQVEFEMLPK